MADCNCRFIDGFTDKGAIDKSYTLVFTHPESAVFVP